MKRQDKTDIFAHKTKTVFIVGVKSTVLGTFTGARAAIRAGTKHTQQYPNAKVWYVETEVTDDEEI